MTTSTRQLTAADHFRAGEDLLAETGQQPLPGIRRNYEREQADAARALAHFKAAEVLLKAEELQHARSAVGRTGFHELLDERWKIQRDTQS